MSAPQPIDVGAPASALDNRRWRADMSALWPTGVGEPTCRIYSQSALESRNVGSIASAHTFCNYRPADTVAIKHNCFVKRELRYSGFTPNIHPGTLTPNGSDVYVISAYINHNIMQYSDMGKNVTRLKTDNHLRNF